MRRTLCRGLPAHKCTLALDGFIDHPVQQCPVGAVGHLCRKSGTEDDRHCRSIPKPGLTDEARLFGWVIRQTAEDHGLSDLDQVFTENAVIPKLAQFGKLASKPAATDDLFSCPISFYCFHLFVISFFILAVRAKP